MRAKKILLVCLSVLMMLSLAACGNDADSTVDNGAMVPGSQVLPDNNGSDNMMDNAIDGVQEGVDDMVDGMQNGVDNVVDGVQNGADDIIKSDDSTKY